MNPRAFFTLIAIAWPHLASADDEPSIIKPDWKPTTLTQFFGEFFDIMPIDDADLQPLPEVKPPQDSSYYQWIELGPLGRLPRALRETLKDELIIDEATLAEITRLSADKKKAIAKFENLIGDPSFVVPTSSNLGDKTFSMRLRDLADWYQLSFAKAAHRQDWDELFQLYRRLLDLSSRFRPASPTFVELLVHDAVENVVMEHLSRVLGNLDRKELTEAQRLIERIEARPRPIKEAMKREYIMLSKIMRQMEHGRTDLIAAQPESRLKGIPLILYRTFLFKEHFTRHLVAKDFRQIISSLDKPLWKVEQPKLDARRQHRMLRSLLTGNLLGRVILELSLPVKVRYIRRHHVNVQLHKLLVRVQQKTVLSGERVEKLEAQDLGLKEQDLMDPFSGKPFLFDSERQIIWSVGTNGIDDGGEKRGRRDLVVKIHPPTAA